MPNRVASINEWVAGYRDGQYVDEPDDDEEDEEERLTTEQALGQIVDGNLTTSRFGLYLSAWELICSLVGDRLPEQWAVRQAWVEPCDAWLQRAAWPVRISELVDSPSPPFPLPENPYL